ncbi:MAG: acyl-CoA thioesterase [Proteobacteria bacterium]|nr:acyl-CoA thioesterase [Pseudomonadota bacterium]MDA1058142.1 acyl-CoA thioesterase [Pseudomonadota bacterium]
MEPQRPSGEPAIRTMAMPGDANANGDIFGGWVLSQMDLAGGALSAQVVRGRTATVAIEAMTFHKPVFIGDLVSCYVELVKTGRTSLTVKIDTFATRRFGGEEVRVTEGIFVYVAIDDRGKPRPIADS